MTFCIAECRCDLRVPQIWLEREQIQILPLGKYRLRDRYGDTGMMKLTVCSSTGHNVAVFKDTRSSFTTDDGLRTVALVYPGDKCLSRGYLGDSVCGIREVLGVN